MRSMKNREWVFWNLAVCGFWGACLARIPVWPMLFLVLPLQVGSNFVLVYLFKRSRLTALVSLGTIGAFTAWLFAVRYGSWKMTMIGLLPLFRVLWQIWIERKQLLLEVND